MVTGCDAGGGPNSLTEGLPDPGGKTGALCQRRCLPEVRAAEKHGSPTGPLSLGQMGVWGKQQNEPSWRSGAQ